MRQAISTKYRGPTNTLGARVVAKADAGSLTVQWDYSLGVAGNHLAAARRLAEKLDWGGEWFGGSLESNGYCFVLADHAPDSSFTVGG